mmetsp:Transcript_57132/g.148447  ORF Transcript_57132/g.148447 Transcript_57132/m.148447 type:complete len:205 (+) Transcript_57132:672-1286(+)
MKGLQSFKDLHHHQSQDVLRHRGDFVLDVGEAPIVHVFQGYVDTARVFVNVRMVQLDKERALRYAQQVVELVDELRALCLVLYADDLDGEDLTGGPVQALGHDATCSSAQHLELVNLDILGVDAVQDVLPILKPVLADVDPGDAVAQRALLAHGPGLVHDRLLGVRRQLELQVAKVAIPGAPCGHRTRARGAGAYLGRSGGEHA